MLQFSIHKVIKKDYEKREKFVCNRKATFLGVFRAVWRIRIHANNSHVWKLRNVNIKVQQSTPSYAINKNVNFATFPEWKLLT